MKKTEIPHPDAREGFSTGAFSSGVLVDGWLYVSGQGPIDFAKGKFVLGTIEEETRLTLHNVQRILEAAGCTWDNVVKSTVHLADIADFAAYNQVYASYFSGVKPARTTVQSGLANGIKVEIDVVAKAPDTDE
ncbi:MAG: Rid family detoxifying hydrolase [Cytophagaceae bacterium]|nr:Rid family detoxifying hydrolase [Cytophagaceae bacterium]